MIRSLRAVLPIFVLMLIASAASAQWVPLGPEGGDVRSIAYDPQNPDRVFLGTSSGRLYISNNNGRSWARFATLGDDTDYVLDNIEIDPTNSSIIYVAAWSSVDQISRGDLFRSHDGGKTWQAIPFMHGKSIRAMTMAPSDHRVLVVGALDGVFRSNNSGDTWERVSPAGHVDIKNIESIAIDPRDPNVIYAGTWHLPWKTNDGGRTWHSIKNGVVDDSDVFSIIVDHGNSGVVYASACSGIYKSESAGELFRKIQGIPFSARRTRVLQQDPSNSDVVYAGTTEGLWKTTDAGKLWRRITAPNVIVNDVMVDPRNSQRLLIATDRGGVLASNDGGQTFAASNQGYSHRQVSTIVTDRRDPSTVYAGLVNDKEFGGVFVSRDGGRSWTQLSNGLNGRDIFSLRQAENGALIAGTNSGVFALGRGDSLWKPINLVLTEKLPKPPPKTAKRTAKKITAPKPEWVKSELSGRVAEIDTIPGKWFAAASSGLYVSSDDGRSWHGGAVLGHKDFVAVQASDKQVVAATPRAAVLSVDGGSTWNLLNVPRYVTFIYGVSLSPGSMWLATREGALQSRDNGATWEHTLNGLPARNIRYVAYDSLARQVFAATNSGELFASTEGAQPWHRVENGWRVRAIAAGRGRVLAATAFDGIVAQPEERPQTTSLGAAKGSGQ